MERNDQYPFQPFKRERAKLFGSFFDVHEIADDPRFVVKERSGYSSFDPEHELKRITHDIELCKKHLGPYMPETMAVVGKGAGGRPTIFLVQERIEGKPVGSEEQISPDELRLLDDFVCRMIALYRDTYNPERDRGLVPDVVDMAIERNNLFIGKAIRRPDESPRPYLIDVYPLLYAGTVGWQNKARRWIYFLEDQQERIEGGWKLVPLNSPKALEEALLEIYQKQMSP